MYEMINNLACPGAAETLNGGERNVSDDAANSAKLEAAIRQNLGGLGYGG